MLRARVVSDMSDHSRSITEHASLFQSKTGMRLFPGTVKLDLEIPWHSPPGCLRIEPLEYGEGTNLVPCEIDGIKGYILRTDMDEAGPAQVIEVAAPVDLKDVLALMDGD